MDGLGDAGLRRGARTRGVTPAASPEVVKYGPRLSVPVPPVGGVLSRRTEGAFCGYVSGQPNSFWGQALTVLYFTAPDGTETEFVDVATGGATEFYSGYVTGYDRGRSFRAMDGSAAIVTTTSDIIDPVEGCPSATSAVQGATMIQHDGTKYTFDINGIVTQIEDRNGNLTSIVDGAAGNNPTSAADALGRSVVYTPTTNGATITYPGESGVQRTVKVTTLNASANNYFTNAYGKYRPLLRTDQTYNTAQVSHSRRSRTAGGLSG